MKVGIVGAGAMGCLFGSFLAKEVEEVWLIDLWKEHITQINQSGLVVINIDELKNVSVKATTNAADVDICDLLIFATKYQHTQNAVKSAATMINDNTVIITLQNGLGNVDIISQFVNNEMLVFGVTTLGSVIKGPGIIEATVTDVGKTYLWTFSGEPNEKVQEVIAVFNKAGLKFILSPDVKERIWKKLCLNAGLSIPLAIFRLNCGDYICQPHALELTRCLVSEIVSVAGKEGVRLDAELMYKDVVKLAKKSPSHRTSALLDVLNHRKTEIDVINGAIIKKAEKHNINTPYNSTIYNIIKIMENTYESSIKNL